MTNGDYNFGKSGQDFLSGTLAVAQAVKTHLLLLKDEWWEDKEDGLPLFENILGLPGTPENLQSIDLLVQGRISTTTDVISIKDFVSSYADRSYSVACTVETKYGDATISMTF